MTLKRGISSEPDDERRDTNPRPAVAACPICEGDMQVVYSRNNQQVAVCKDCQTGLTLPSSAWEVLRMKRESE